MTEILLIRHGETAWNVERRIQGQRDIPLNPEGERQAAALGRVLKNEMIDAVFCSDLRRARQTADQIGASCNLAVQQDIGLRERRFGVFEGLTPIEIQTQYPDAYRQWRMRDVNARFPTNRVPAETLTEFFSRVVTTIKRLVKNAESRKIAIVTHGGVLDCMYRAATATDLAKPRDFDILNTGVNRLTWNDDRFQIVQWADTAHLRTSALDEMP